MPHLFSDRDDYIPGGAGGLDDGEKVMYPWVRPAITAEQFDAAPLRGWWSGDLYCRWAEPVREIAGELITLGRGFFFAVQPAEVFLARPPELEDHTERDALPRLQG